MHQIKRHGYIEGTPKDYVKGFFYPITSPILQMLGFDETPNYSRKFDDGASHGTKTYVLAITTGMLYLAVQANSLLNPPTNNETSNRIVSTNDVKLFSSPPPRPNRTTVDKIIKDFF